MREPVLHACCPWLLMRSLRSRHNTSGIPIPSGDGSLPLMDRQKLQLHSGTLSEAKKIAAGEGIEITSASPGETKGLGAAEREIQLKALCQ